MTQEEKYGCLFLRTLQKLTSLTIFDYHTTHDVRTLDQQQLARRLQKHSYEFFRIVRDNPAPVAAKLLRRQLQQLRTALVPPASRSVSGRQNETDLPSDQPTTSDGETYGSLFITRLRELTRMTSFNYRDLQEIRCLNQEQFARRMQKKSYALYQLISENTAEAAAEIIWEQQQKQRKQQQTAWAWMVAPVSQNCS
ncbi:MAG TPA: hypothetical protein EYG03_07205 [Planctomycetes bacterium]|nr:hypothetical protein [Planctomycetota bacterium]